ncbi:MAG: hypothetical protein Q4E53_11055 [Eubacteriales bacterium]|nr:hypothetical protein [Eubacteriales bacterium]
MARLQRIMNRYVEYFNLKDVNLELVITKDMYETQKNYGFSETDTQRISEAVARQNWKHVAACMKFPKSIDDSFALIFKEPYLRKVEECELYRLMFHELTHYVDYKEYARIHNLKSYQELFHSQQTVLFQNWSEYHAERRGYAAYLKHRHGVRLQYDVTPKKIKIMEDETLRNLMFYAEHYTNTAEYGSSRQIYFTMHLLARMSIWMQILPSHVAEILSKDPFNYKGIEWIKKLMLLFAQYPTLEKMDPHLMDIAKIIAENLALPKEEIYDLVASMDAIDEIIC